MINPEDEITIDLSASCTEEVAVAKLLGWLNGPIHPKVIPVTEHGISEDQLPFLQSIEGSLEEQLLELREAARQKYVAAAEADESFEELKEKEEAVTAIDSLIHKASKYLADIKDELSKGEDSAIKIDQATPEKKGITHVTLRSLDRWAKKKYGISILVDQTEQVLPNKNNERSTTSIMEEDLDTTGGLSRTKADNLYTTFAFLVEEFVKNSSKKYGDEGPNIAALARRLEQVTTDANKGAKLKGQSHEAIKDRIEAAKKIMKSKLPQG